MHQDYADHHAIQLCFVFLLGCTLVWNDYSIYSNLSCYWLPEQYDSDEEESGDKEKNKVSTKMATKKTRVR